MNAELHHRPSRWMVGGGSPTCAAASGCSNPQAVCVVLGGVMSQSVQQVSRRMDRTALDEKGVVQSEKCNNAALMGTPDSG